MAKAKKAKKSKKASLAGEQGKIAKEMKDDSSCDMSLCHKKILFSGIIAGLWIFFSGYIVWAKLFGTETMSHEHLWRPEHDMMLHYMLLGDVLIGIGISYLFARLGCGICCPCPYTKGVKFGLMLWFIMGLGGGVFWYGLYNVSMTLLWAYWIDSASSLLIGSVIISRIHCGFGGSSGGSSGSSSSHCTM